MSIGERITERLTVLDISQAELGRRTGLAQSTINTLVKRSPRSTPHLMRLAAALRTTPAYLLGETDDPESEAAQALLSFEEHELLDALRRMSREDFMTIVQLAFRLAEPRLAEHRGGYVFRAEDVEDKDTLHDRQLGFSGKPDGKVWGD